MQDGDQAGTGGELDIENDLHITEDVQRLVLRQLIFLEESGRDESHQDWNYRRWILRHS